MATKKSTTTNNTVSAEPRDPMVERLVSATWDLWSAEKGFKDAMETVRKGFISAAEEMERLQQRYLGEAERTRSGVENLTNHLFSNIRVDLINSYSVKVEAARVRVATLREFLTPEQVAAAEAELAKFAHLQK